MFSYHFYKGFMENQFMFSDDFRSYMILNDKYMINSIISYEFGWRMSLNCNLFRN